VNHESVGLAEPDRLASGLLERHRRQRHASLSWTSAQIAICSARCDGGTEAPRERCLDQPFRANHGTNPDLDPDEIRSDRLGYRERSRPIGLEHRHPKRKIKPPPPSHVPGQ